MKYPYAILDVGENAPQEEIRQAYLEKLKMFPPEKNQAKFQEITDAWHLVESELARAKLKIFGIPQEVNRDLKPSDLFSSNVGELKRPGMEFWLKLLKQEPSND